MNPWQTQGVDERRGAAYRVSLGGLKAFVERNQLASTPAMCVDTSGCSSVQLMQSVNRLIELKTATLRRVRELEQMEMEIATAGVLLPRQLDAKIETVRALYGDLEDLVAMKSVLLRTLQKNVASEYLDVELDQQRTFIDLFLKLSGELPRLATAMSAPESLTPATNVLRQRHKQYEAVVSQCKTAIAKFHALQDEMAQVRRAYAMLQDVTSRAAETGVED